MGKKTPTVKHPKYWCVYALVNGRCMTYLGSTNCFRRRFQQHHSGAPSSAHHYTNRQSNRGIPWCVGVIVRGFTTSTQARAMECRLKPFTRHHVSRAKHRVRKSIKGHKIRTPLERWERVANIPFFRAVALGTKEITDADQFTFGRVADELSIDVYHVRLRPFVSLLSSVFPRIRVMTEFAPFDRGPYWCGVRRRVHGPERELKRRLARRDKAKSASEQPVKKRKWMIQPKLVDVLFKQPRK